MKFFREFHWTYVFAILFVFGLVIVGCGGGDGGPTEPAKPTMDGTWQGTVRQGRALYILQLSQRGSIVTGNGTLSYSDQVYSGTINGTNVYPNVSLTFSTPGYKPFTFTGSFSDDNTIPGVLNGSGFTDEPLTLVRQ